MSGDAVGESGSGVDSLAVGSRIGVWVSTSVAGSVAISVAVPVAGSVTDPVSVAVETGSETVDGLPVSVSAGSCRGGRRKLCRIAALSECWRQASTRVVRNSLSLNLSPSYSLFLLLMAPDLHDDPVRQQFGKQNLRADGKAANRHILTPSSYRGARAL